MFTVNIHEAKAQLSKLVDQAVKGEAFVIAKAGKPLVKVALDASRGTQRLGFLEGEIAVPDDFNRMGETEIAALSGSRSGKLLLGGSVRKV
jgi:antitoxin (DNA-binding transcriptional repressor) of toxin-antitoxin stability system